jgi:predicted ferric reductase
MRPTPFWRSVTIWAALAVVMLAPVVLAAFSPYLAYRNAAYIMGGFAGIVCLSLLVIQPLLADGALPGLPLHRARRWHRVVGTLIALGVALHVAGLYLTSPMDTLDALLLVAPNTFSVFGVAAMWAVLLTLLIVTLRRRIRPAVWRRLHIALAAVIVIGTIIHAVQIQGAMEPISKALLCLAALCSSVLLIAKRRRRVTRTAVQDIQLRR